MHVSILSLFSFLALVSVTCRLWARKIQKLRLDLNDYLYIFGLIFALASAVFAIHCESFICKDLTVNFLMKASSDDILGPWFNYDRH